MRWIFVRNAVNFCKKCGEMWWIIYFHRIHRFHRISYIILPQTLMRWIFVRNAVNFAVNLCKKCVEMWWIIYFHCINRNHRISYKNSPHSPHFLQKITLKPRPGWCLCSRLFLVVVFVIVNILCFLLPLFCFINNEHIPLSQSFTLRSFKISHSIWIVCTVLICWLSSS